MSVWPVYAVAVLYVAVSPLLNTVLAQSGLYAPLVCAVGGGTILLIASAVRRWGRCAAILTLYSFGMLVYFLIVTAHVTDVYLYHGKAGLSLMALLSAFAAIGLFVRESALRSACRLFLWLGIVLYGLVMLIGLRHWEWRTLFPVASVSGNDFLRLTICAALSFLPLLLPFLSKEHGMRVTPLAVSVGVVVLSTPLSLLSYPYHMLSNDKDLFIEVAKNLSFGRFFQRMEFPGMLVFLVVSLLLLVYSAVRLHGFAAACIARKTEKRVCLACLYAAAVILSCLTVDRNQLAVAGLATAGVALLLALLWSMLSTAGRKRATAILLALCLLPLSSCIEYREIDTFDYPLIVGVEPSGEENKYVFRMENAALTVTAPSLLAAKEAINSRNAKPIDLSQLGMVLLPSDDADFILDRIAEIERIDVDNAVILAVTKNDVTDVGKTDFSGFHGVSEYFDEYKSNRESLGFVDRTVFEALASYRNDQTLLLTELLIDDDQLVFSGADAYGRGERKHLTNARLSAVSSLRDQFSDVSISDGVLHVSLHGATAEQCAWLTEIYQTTGRDVIGVYNALAVSAYDREKYQSLLRSIKKVAIN